MTDRVFLGVQIEDAWPAGARFRGSQTRLQARRREDGAQRWVATLPTGQAVHTFTLAEARAAIRQAITC